MSAEAMLSHYVIIHTIRGDMWCIPFTYFEHIKSTLSEFFQTKKNAFVLVEQVNGALCGFPVSDVASVEECTDESREADAEIEDYLEKENVRNHEPKWL